MESENDVKSLSVRSPEPLRHRLVTRPKFTDRCTDAQGRDMGDYAIRHVCNFVSETQRKPVLMVVLLLRRFLFRAQQLRPLPLPHRRKAVIARGVDELGWPVRLRTAAGLLPALCFPY